jgi:carbonic anhydrase
MAREFESLLEGNRRFVESMLQKDKNYFIEHAKGQTPEFLWIGCSDSRVPENEITDTLPGEIFVHRNIANMVVNTDMNLLSVLHYSVTNLKVKHVIVCGHYGCGGVLAAMSNRRYGLIDNWLSNIKDVFKHNDKELMAITDDHQRAKRMVELNVIQQVMNLSKVSIFQEAWKDGPYPILHGWVYDLENGVIKDLNVSLDETDDISHIIYKFDL